MKTKIYANVRVHEVLKDGLPDPNAWKNECFVLDYLGELNFLKGDVVVVTLPGPVHISIGKVVMRWTDLNANLLIVILDFTSLSASNFQLVGRTMVKSGWLPCLPADFGVV